MRFLSETWDYARTVDECILPRPHARAHLAVVVVVPDGNLVRRDSGPTRSKGEETEREPSAEPSADHSCGYMRRNVLKIVDEDMQEGACEMRVQELRGPDMSRLRRLRERALCTRDCFQHMSTSDKSYYISRAERVDVLDSSSTQTVGGGELEVNMQLLGRGNALQDFISARTRVYWV